MSAEQKGPPPPYMAGQPQYPPPGQAQYAQPGQAPYPQPGYAPQPAHMASQQSSSVVVVQQGGQRALGSCPICGVGFGRTEYTTLGIIIAILFFPLGVICCMMMTERRCTSCHAHF